MQTEEPFSKQLEDWLKSDSPKTLGGLGAVFEEKSFAVAILLLMFIPALPLPTGGITHVFEAITYNAALTVHVTVLGGRDPHHIAEAEFKAFARAFRQAKALDPLVAGIPSTKGAL